MSSVPSADSVLQRQQQQYAEYVRAHQLQRSASHSARSAVSSSSGGARTPGSPLGGAGGGQRLGESLLAGGGGEGVAGDDYSLHQDPHEEPVLHLADGRQLRGHAAVKARAGLWVSEQISWSDRSFRAKLVLLLHLAVCFLATTWILQVGCRHTKDDFTDTEQSKTDPSMKTNTCEQLPLFLIVSAALLYVAIGTIGMLVGFAICGAQRKLETVSFASLLLLLSLACLFFIWSIIGQVWTFSAKTNICGGQLYDTSLWLIIVSYVVAVLQSCLSCCRCACALTKDMLPL